MTTQNKIVGLRTMVRRYPNMVRQSDWDAFLDHHERQLFFQLWEVMHKPETERLIIGPLVRRSDHEFDVLAGSVIETATIVLGIGTVHEEFVAWPLVVPVIKRRHTLWERIQYVFTGKLPE